VEQALKDLSRYAGRSEPALASYLGRAAGRYEDGQMVVTLPQGPFAASLCTADNQLLLSRFWAELFSQPIQVRLEAAALAGESEPTAVSKAQLAGELAEHPIVQEAVEIFEAQVVALNPDGAEK
jgi:DNA polymerase-3 subunit gamma/tau